MFFYRLLENDGILVWDSDDDDYDDDAKALAMFGTNQYVSLKTSTSMVTRVVPVAPVFATAPQKKLRMQLGFLPAGFVDKFESSVDEEEEQYRLDSDMRTFGCTAVKWSKDRIRLFQDMTSSALLRLWLLKVNWRKWRTVYTVNFIDLSSEFGQKMGGTGASLVSDDQLYVASSNTQRLQLIKLRGLVTLTMQHCLLQQCLVNWNIAVAVVKVASALLGVSAASSALMELPPCMHPDLICPGGWLQNGIDYVENMFCSHCNTKVNIDVDSCCYEDVRCFYRWRSDVARIYLRSVRGAMHDVSALMASGAGMATVMLAGN